MVKRMGLYLPWKGRRRQYGEGRARRVEEIRTKRLLQDEPYRTEGYVYG
jgi:hypothetical protein